MKSLMTFKYINASSMDSAVEALRQYGDKAWILAGGSDLMGTMRFEVLRNYPEAVINLKTIPGLDYIKKEDGILKIGAMTRLEDIAVDPAVRNRYSALAEAARRTASPQIRAMGTIGGNICQLIRCWYFRKEDNLFDCIRKGGKMCHAIVGDNRYNSIFGSVRVSATPCSSACPAGVNIPSYISKIRDNDLTGAAEILLDSNPLPAITGRVCPHYCERECNRGDYDEAVSVRSIERYLGDYILENAGKVCNPPQSESGKSVAIVGSGPAGLAAAYYLRKLGHEVTIFETMEEAGGILTYGIPAYRLPKIVVRTQVKAIESMGVQFKLKVNLGKDITLDKLRKDFDAVFCATGAWKQSSLKIKDEELLISGLDFLMQVNRGVRKISAKKVLVIGGGSVATDIAISLRRLGVAQVIMACLESREEMPALKEEVEQAVKEGVKLMPSWGPLKVLKEKDKVSGMELMRCTSVYDSERKFAPTYNSSIKETVEADQIILAIGQKPDIAYTESSLQVNQGFITVAPDTQISSIANVFAGGDVTGTTPASVSSAIAAGRRAAIAINKYLGGKEAVEIEKKVEPLNRSVSDYLIKSKRVEVPEVPVSQVSIETEDILCLDFNSVVNETNRCFDCGCVGVNPSDTAAALVVLGARIITTKRIVEAEDFWAGDKAIKATVLDNDEIVTEIQIPAPAAGLKSAFIKFALRKSIDFPIVNCAAAIETHGGIVRSARICLNAVYCRPYRVTLAEDVIRDKPINEVTAEAAGTAAVTDAISLPYNSFKIQIAKTLVKRAILACQ
jgi:NADPH-dependent glutamate synthase beta subunit-like oxidoreductase/CO/xanthine dehydrogenase FAD-binding subunit